MNAGTLARKDWTWPAKLICATTGILFAERNRHSEANAYGSYQVGLRFSGR